MKIDLIAKDCKISDNLSPYGKVSFFNENNYICMIVDDKAIYFDKEDFKQLKNFFK